MQKIFDNNRKWREDMLKADPECFDKMSQGQQPEYLLIGCSDSRVGAQEIMGMNQGELFVHRNVANLVVPTDLNFLSVLFYSVNVLKVKEIIVMGHYGCGGVQASSQNQDLGLIEHWLKNIRDVQRHHADELMSIKDPDKRFRRLVELNVQEQCFNLYTNSIVQQMQAKTGRPRIHGMVYDISDGLLQYLDIDFKEQIRKYRSIYTVADFRSYAPINISEVGKEPEEAAAKRKELAKVLFDAIDIDGNGKLDRYEIKEALTRYGQEEVSAEKLDEIMEPFLGVGPDTFDVDSFEKIIQAILKEDGIETDRLVVIRPASGQDPPTPIQCRGSTTIIELKQAIEKLTGMPVERQKLYHNNVKLRHDSAILAEVGISDISEVELREEFVPSAFKPPNEKK